MDNNDTVGLGAVGLMALAIVMVLFLTIVLPAVTTDAAGILGFAGNLIGVAGTLIAAAIAWRAVQRQIAVQREIADRQSALQEFTALELGLTADNSDRELLAAIDESFKGTVGAFTTLLEGVRRGRRGRGWREGYGDGGGEAPYQTVLNESLNRSGTRIAQKIKWQILAVADAQRSIGIILRTQPQGLEGMMQPVDPKILPELEAIDLADRVETLRRSIAENLNSIEIDQRRLTKMKEAAAKRAGIV
jgi:hypothetical protein